MRFPLTSTLLIATQLIRTSLGLPSTHHGNDGTIKPKTRHIRATANLATTLVTPGEATGTIVLDDDNTLNSTTSNTNQLPDTINAQHLSLALVNNLAGKVDVYVTGLTPNGQLVMLQSDGTLCYPTCTGSQTTPLLITADTAFPLGTKGSTISISIPGYIQSTRVWFAADDILKFYIAWNEEKISPLMVLPSAVDPSAAVKWGIIELTFLKEKLFVNLGYVDFVGLVLGV